MSEPAKVVVTLWWHGRHTTHAGVIFRDRGLPGVRAAADGHRYHGLAFGADLELLARLLNGVPSGSYLAISHPTTEVDAEPMIQAVQFWNEQGSAPMRLRTREEIARFFDGADLVRPGVVSCSRWRPGQDDSGEIIAEVTHFCGVARKP